MSTQDDLATLRRWVDGEREIARLELERDEAWFEERRGIDPAGSETVSVWCRRCGAVHQSPVHCPDRYPDGVLVDVAEARDIADSLLAEDGAA